MSAQHRLEALNAPFKCIVQKTDRAWCKSKELIVREMDRESYATGQQSVCLSEDEDGGGKKKAAVLNHSRQ